MDEARLEAAGLDGLRDELRRIHDVTDKAALPALFAHLSRLWVRIPWELDVDPDEHDATHYVAHLSKAVWACRTATTISRTMRISRRSAPPIAPTSSNC